MFSGIGDGLIGTVIGQMKGVETKRDINDELSRFGCEENAEMEIEEDEDEEKMIHIEYTVKILHVEGAC
jgi:hypothetical protein